MNSIISGGTVMLQTNTFRTGGDLCTSTRYSRMYMECTIEGADRNLGRIRLACIIACEPRNCAEEEYPEALQVLASVPP